MTKELNNHSYRLDFSLAFNVSFVRITPPPFFFSSKALKFTFHVLLKLGLENFEHYFTSI